MAMGYMLGGQSSIPDRGNIFSALQRPDGPLGPPSLLYSGCRGSFPGVQRSGRGANHSPPSIVEFKNGEAIAPLPHMLPWSGA
jgi:hypothetical protein